MGGAVYWSKSWNPVTGCGADFGCWEHCWARAMVRQFSHLDGGSGFRPGVLHRDRLVEPLHWQPGRWKVDPDQGSPRARVQTCWLGDLFHDRVPRAHIAAVFAVMEQQRGVDFLLLTKRAGRMREAAEACLRGRPRLPGHIWGGVSVSGPEDLARVGELAAAPFSVRWVSYEPALAGVDFGLVPAPAGGLYDALRGIYQAPGGAAVETPRLDWIVVGSEMGPGASPPQDEWLVDLVAAADAAGVPVWVKQWTPGLSEPEEASRRDTPYTAAVRRSA
jgi:protein gp37